MKKSVIVIGAGVAGLSAGCYAAMNGFQTRIYEMHTSPGGLCTAWRRGGYTVDGCIHWLVGSKPGTPMYGVWEELGAVQGRTFFYAEEFQRFEGSDGRVFTFSTNLERLEQHMREVAPQDGEPISRFCNAVREFTGTNLPVSRPTSDMMRPFLKWNRMPMTEILAEFKSPLIRKAICHAWPECFPAGFLLATLAWLNDKAAGYPIGGSLDFSRALERRYLGLGGELSYKSRVSRILVEADSAVGVQLEDGSEHQADFVISAADGHATIFDWLRGRYVDRTIQGYYENLTPFPSLVLVALGVNRKFEDVPVLLSSLHIELAEPLRVADCTLRSLSIRVFNNDSTLAPPERTTVLCSFVSDESWWKDLRRDPSGYCPGQERDRFQSDRRPGPPLPQLCLPGGNDRRCNAVDVRALYGQLEGEHRGVDGDSADRNRPAPQHAAGPCELLDVRPVGGAGRRAPSRGAFRAAGPSSSYARRTGGSSSPLCHERGAEPGDLLDRLRHVLLIRAPRGFSRLEGMVAVGKKDDPDGRRQRVGADLFPAAQCVALSLEEEGGRGKVFQVGHPTVSSGCRWGGTGSPGTATLSLPPGPPPCLLCVRPWTFRQSRGLTDFQAVPPRESRWLPARTENRAGCVFRSFGTPACMGTRSASRERIDRQARGPSPP